MKKNLTINKYLINFFLLINIFFFLQLIIYEKKIGYIIFLWVSLFVIFFLFIIIFKKSSNLSFKYTLIILFFSISLSTPKLNFDNSYFILFEIFFKLVVILIIIFLMFDFFKSKLIKNTIYIKNEVIVSNYNSLLFSSFILLIIFFMIPLNLLMYNFSIGITGVQGPALPFKLNGILSIFSKFVIPFLIFILYLNTNRKSFFLITFIGIYSVYSGCISVSRTAPFAFLIGPIILAFFEKRLFLLIYIFILFLLSFSIITISREFIYVFTEGGLIHSREDILEVIFNSFNKLDTIILLEGIPSFSDRLLGISSLLHSNDSLVAKNIDALVLWKGMMNNSYYYYNPYIQEILSIEQTGKIPTPGTTNLAFNFFYITIIAMKNSFFSIFLFCGTFVLFFFTLELASFKIMSKYKIKQNYISFFIFLNTFWFLVSPIYYLSYIIYFIVISLSLLPNFPRLITILKHFKISK